ncbi:hypothetical protein NC653_000921 [Populus alba x Populus x berolinensis]|uniref:Uncharacterized protein n=1 Tax=Populus alba x Populus x berolinensis TaxID=444605 RepID=A0AAD6WH75_9ROSI|nr:hypothetical protein NC653_000921 [Populus alba x Populus x berolinensis]
MLQDHFTKVKKMEIDMKYIDPTYMIRALPSNASDNISCTLLAQSAVHGAMAGSVSSLVLSTMVKALKSSNHEESKNEPQM